MDYCIVNSDSIIENIIVCESDEIAAQFGAVTSYDGAAIGGKYSPPPPPPTTDERLEKLESENKLLREQVSAQADQAEFYEECIAEMAAIVYA
nr:MAG TPA: Gamma-aminobutyric acid type B receptor(B) receptor, coiled-coil, heterodimer, SIGNALING.62A [Caudoviricetes sp.]